MITNLCQEIEMTGMYYAPYNPFAKQCAFIKQVDDVDGVWYTMQIRHQSAIDWIVEELPVGSWRYSVYNPPGWVDVNLIDLREDAYSWFLLRWS